MWGLLYRRLPVGSDVSQIEFQGQKGIEGGFMLLMLGWCAELKESNWSPLPLRSDNVRDGIDTRTHIFLLSFSLSAGARSPKLKLLSLYFLF